MWYIVNYGRGPQVIFMFTHPSYTSEAIGPYFTYKEAMAVLYYWTK